MTRAPSAAADGPNAPPLSRRLLPLVLLAALALVYGPGLAGDFVYDDVRLIVNNPRLESLDGLWQWLRTPHWSFDEPIPEGQLGHWRPLTVLALALGHLLGGGGVLGHHLVSLALHLAASLVVARLVRRVSGSVQLGVAGALLFALHPVQVEAVAWASAVNDPLYALLALLALERWSAWRRRGSPGLPLAATVAFLGSLLAKEQGLVVPVLLVGHDLAAHLLAGRDGETEELPLARSYVPLALVLALYLGLRMAVFGSWTAGFDRQSVDFPLTPLREVTYRLELLGGFLGLLVWPAELAVFRPFRPELPAGDPTLWIAGALVAAYGILLAVLWRRASRTVRTLALLLPLTLLPQLGPLERVGAYPLSDRYLYLTVAFLAALVAAGARRLLPERVAPAALTVLALALGVQAHRHARVFEDNEAFSLAALEASPRVPAVHWQRGNLLLQRYEVEQDLDLVREAFVHFLRSLSLGTDYGREPELPPDAPVARRLDELQRIVIDTPASKRRPDPTVFVSGFDRLNANLGQGFCYLYLATAGPDRDLSMAATVFEETARLFPNSELARLGQGLVHKLRGELERAEEVLGRAVTLNELRPDTWHELGDVLYRRGKWEGARNAFQRALRLRPSDVRDRLAIARCAIEEGRADIAALRLAEARELRPDSLEVLFWSGMLAAREGDLPDALAWFERALSVDERYGRAHLEKARVLLHLGENQAAVRSLGRACELMPESFEAHYNLGSLLDQAGQGEAALPYLVQAYGLGEGGELRDRLHLRLAQLMAGDGKALLDMAAVAQRNRDPEAALDWVERAVEEDEATGRSGRAHYLRGRYLQLLDRPVEAAGALKLALEFEEADFWTRHDLGLLLATRLERREEAEPHLRRALELLEEDGPEDEQLRGAIRENLTAALEGRRPQMTPTLEPIRPLGVEER